MTTPQDQTPPHISLLAILALVLALLSFVFSILAGIPAIFLGSIARSRIENNPDRLAGTGYAKWAVNLAFVGSIITMGLYLLFPYHHACGESANRSACAANIKGLVVSMQVYANENDNVLPIGAPPKKIFTYSIEFSANTAKTNPHDAVEFMQSPTLAGQVLSPFWIMVLTQQVSPKSFICQEDPFSKGYPVASAKNDRGEYFAMFQKANQISYAIAYPWALDPQTKAIGPAAYWRLNSDENLPLMSDMPPLNGTGKPRRNVEITEVPGNSLPRPYFGFNHAKRIGDGANFGFADGHVEWRRTPAIGQNNDNAYTSGGIPGDPSRADKAPTAGRIEPIITTQPPFDTVMVPMRDGNTGELK